MRFYDAKHRLLYALTIGLVKCLAVTTALASPAPVPTIYFEALEDNDTIFPPDTNGAVGPEFVMTALNSQVRIQNKVGDPFSTVDLQQFWSGTPNLAGPVVDPVTVFDPYTKRFFFAGSTTFATHQLVIAVSQTSDPRGNWYRWAVPAPNGIDQPKIGFNGKWIAVQYDIFPGSVIFLFDKASLVAGSPPRLTSQQEQPSQNYQVILPPAEKGVYISPARTYDANLPDLYLLQSSDHSDQQSLNALSVFKISGDSAATATFSMVGQASSLDNSWTSRFDAAHGAPQIGYANSISADDDRIHSCVYRNGSLWTAQTVFLPNAAPTISAVQWWQISLFPSISVVQRAIIGGPGVPGVPGLDIVEVLDENEFREKEGEVPSSLPFRAYPSLAVNANEDVLIGYSIFSASSSASAAYSLRWGTDVPGGLQTEAGMAIGEGTYLRHNDAPPYRWGDYSAAVVDPINDRDFWTIQEFSGAQGKPTDNTHWKTAWLGIPKTFARFAAGEQHSFGQRLYGTLNLSASGNNWVGQLGNGAGGMGNLSNIPVGVSQVSSVRIIDVAAGTNSNIAVDTDGTVYTWGANNYGQLGIGSTTQPYVSIPTVVTGLDLFANGYIPVVTYFGDSPSIVACNMANCAAVDNLGQVWTWGFNLWGQLGDGTVTSRYSPGLVKKDATGTPLTDVVSIAVGAAQMVALKTDGTVWAWGSGYRGALGDGDLSNHNHLYPQQVLKSAGQPLTNTAKVVCGGNNFALALTRDGKIYGWGENGAYQLGLGNNSHKEYATLIAEGADRIAAGGYHALAHSPDGLVRAWGYNGWGQCGFGVPGSPGVPFNQPVPRIMGGDNSAFTDVVGGTTFSLLIRGGIQTVFGVGDNQSGQLATGNNVQQNLPIQTQYHP